MAAFNKFRQFVEDIAKGVHNLATGALTHWIDRKNAYDFAGTATKDASGCKFNGTTDILTSTAAISQLNGAAAATVIFAGVGTGSAATMMIIEHGPLGTSAGKFMTYANVTGTRIRSAGYVTVASEYYATEALATAAVITTGFDTALASGEANLIRKNGAALSTTVASNGNNAGTLGSFTLNLGARFGGTLGWAGSLRKVLVFSRALTAGEMLQTERAVGVITGITVA